MNNTTSATNLQNLVEADNKRPYIYDLLEFNSDIQDLDLTSKIEEYRMLTEAIALSDNNQDISVVYEGMIANVFKRLAELIGKLIRYIKDLINNSTNTFKKNQFEDANKNAEKVYSDFKSGHKSEHTERMFGKKLTFVFYKYPDIEKLDLASIKNCINNLINDLKSAANGDDIDYDERTLRNAYGILKRNIEKCASSIRKPTDGQNNVTNNTSFFVFLRDQVCYTEEKDMTLLEYCTRDLFTKDASYPDGAVYRKAFNLFERELAEAQRILSNTNNPTLPKKNVKLVETIVHDIYNITDAYTKFISMVRNFHVRDFDYRTNVGIRIHKGANKEPDSDYEYVNDSAMIHGEPFNSDTLFDNEDLRDFNRTEWLDLNLTMECHNVKYELTEGRKTIAIKEALIISDNEPNKISRLQSMREAEEKKSSSKIAAAIEAIKKILEKFMQSMTSKFNTTGMYIRTNKGYIDKPIQLNSMKSTGDILAGMYRVQDKVNIIPFDYESMKDDLKDKKTFFKKRILPSLNKNPQCSKRKLAWTDDMEVSTYCKIYYGASMPQDKYPMCEFNSADMESNKPNIVRFLSEKNICFSAKADINNFEAQCRKINITAASSSASGNTTSADAKPENNTEVENESMYYSELYERWITEADIDMGNVQNGEGAAKPNNDVYNAYRVYMDCYKDVLFAKMTGCEFAFSELMQLISMHVAKNGGPKMTMGQKPNNQNQPAANK